MLILSNLGKEDIPLTTLLSWPKVGPESREPRCESQSQVCDLGQVT